MKTPETDALRLVPVPYVVLSEVAGLLDCEGYGPLALTLNNLLAAAPASPLPEGGERDVYAILELSEQIARANEDRNSTVTIQKWAAEKLLGMVQ